MRKFICILVLLLLLGTFGYCMNGPTEGQLLLDDFGSASISNWWTFDIQKINGLSRSLLLQGKARDWYVGGCGKYIAKENLDMNYYNAFQLDIKGNGKNSGTLVIHLFEDDNNNWQVEQDVENNHEPIYDDRFIYEVKIDWKGWKTLVIPFDDFADDNLGVGDNIWNPEQSDKSGGLLQMQFICLATSAKGQVNFNIDNIYLTVERNYE